MEVTEKLLNHVSGSFDGVVSFRIHYIPDDADFFFWPSVSYEVISHCVADGDYTVCKLCGHQFKL